MQLLSLLLELVGKTDQNAKEEELDQDLCREKARDIAYLQWTPYVTDAKSICVLTHPLQTRIHISVKPDASENDVYSVFTWLLHLVNYEKETTFDLYCRTESIWERQDVSGISQLPNVRLHTFTFSTEVAQLYFTQGINRLFAKGDESLFRTAIRFVLDSPELQALEKMQKDLPAFFPFAGDSIQELRDVLTQMLPQLKLFSEKDVQWFRGRIDLLHQFPDLFESGMTHSIAVCIDSSDHSLVEYFNKGWKAAWYSHTGQIRLPSEKLTKGLDFWKSSPKRPPSASIASAARIVFPQYAALLCRTHPPHQSVILLGEAHQAKRPDYVESKEDVHVFLAHLFDSFPDAAFDLWTEIPTNDAIVPYVLEHSSYGFYLLYKAFYQTRHRKNVRAHSADCRMLMHTRALAWYFLHGAVEVIRTEVKTRAEHILNTQFMDGDEENTMALETACEDKLQDMNDNLCPGLRYALTITLKKHLEAVKTADRLAAAKNIVADIRDFLSANKSWPLPDDVRSHLWEYVLRSSNVMDVFALAGMMGNSVQNNILYAGCVHTQRCRDMLVRTGQYRVVEEYETQDKDVNSVQSLSLDKIKQALVK